MENIEDKEFEDRDIFENLDEIEEKVAEGVDEDDSPFDLQDELRHLTK